MLMRSYTSQLSVKERMLHYWLSRATEIIGNTFGILDARWMIYYSPIITSIENAERYIVATIFLVHTPVIQCISQHILLIYRLLVVKYERVSGVKLLMMLLVWALHQMLVFYVIQIMLLLCVKHWRIKLIAKLGALSINEIMCRGHKKTRKFKTRHLCSLLHNFKIISHVRKS